MKKMNKLGGEWESPRPGVYALPLTVFSEKKARRVLRKHAPQLLKELDRVLKNSAQVQVPPTESR